MRTLSRQLRLRAAVRPRSGLCQAHRRAFSRGGAPDHRDKYGRDRRLRRDRPLHRRARGRSRPHGYPPHLCARAQPHLSQLRAGLCRARRGGASLHRRQLRRLFRLSGLPPGIYPAISSGGGHGDRRGDRARKAYRSRDAAPIPLKGRDYRIGNAARRAV